MCAASSLHTDVLEVFAVSTVMHFVEMVNTSLTCLYVEKFESAMAELEISTSETRCWSLGIRASMVADVSASPPTSPDSDLRTASPTIANCFREQSCLSRNLVPQNSLSVLQSRELVVQLEWTEKRRGASSLSADDLSPLPAAAQSAVIALRALNREGDLNDLVTRSEELR